MAKPEINLREDFMDHYLISAEATMWQLDTGQRGLSPEEARERLLKNGRNELAKEKKKSLALRLLEQLTNPMVLILIGAAIVSVIIAVIEGGHANAFAEAGIILAVVIINSILGVYQESKAEKAIEALQEMSASTAKVRRGGVVSLIPAGELVTGDVVLLEAGDAVPADMRLIHIASLRIEEAALTGESVPVDKTTEALGGGEGDGAEALGGGEGDGAEALGGGEACGAEAGGMSGVGVSGGGGVANKKSTVPLGDRKNMAYMGSSVAYGRGEGVVTATGMDTEMGKIAGIIQSAEQGDTPLQVRLAQLSKILTIGVLGICVFIFVLRLVTESQINTDVILGSFMLAVSLAVAAIPEGLVAVVTIALSIGVTKMAKRNAIVRRLTAVETLGCTQIICSDKTGTLTQNLMTVVESYGETSLLSRAMALCCDSRLSPGGEISGDPTENALVAYALKQGLDKNQLESDYPRVAEAPFDSSRKMMSTVHKIDSGIVQYTKGAPDEILNVCTHALIDGKAIGLTDTIIQTITTKNDEFAEKALRVLACAYKDLSVVPEDCAPSNLENNLTFIGLEAMIDPVRPEVKAAVEECKTSGIGVVMITGDHRDTAFAIAKELGIVDNPNQAITGRELEHLSDAEFEERIGDIHVYARVQPEHKVRIVNTWKKKGYITAMTGDGVNDAPALKSGDIGVGMGITGTDVTKNVADMVLADDNFATIVHAVEEGRRIYDNIRKTILFLLGSNLSEVLSILIATIMGFVLFKPVHLLYINLITDCVPAVALGLEPAEFGIMQRPPRGKNEGVFSRGLGVDTLYQGLMVTVLTLLSYFIVDIWHDHLYATTSAFLTMNMCEIFHSFNMRSQRQSVFRLKNHNKILWVAMFGALALVLMVIYVPVFANMFTLMPLTPLELVTSLSLALMVIPIVEAVKFIQRKLEKNPADA